MYLVHNNQKRPISSSLALIICMEKMDKEADEFLPKYFVKAKLQPMWLNLVRLARNVVLTVLRYSIPEGEDIFG